MNLIAISSIMNDMSAFLQSPSQSCNWEAEPSVSESQKTDPSACEENISWWTNLNCVLQPSPKLRINSHIHVRKYHLKVRNNSTMVSCTYIGVCKGWSRDKNRDQALLIFSRPISSSCNWNHKDFSLHCNIPLEKSWLWKLISDFGIRTSLYVTVWGATPWCKRAGEHTP